MEALNCTSLRLRRYRILEHLSSSRCYGNRYAPRCSGGILHNAAMHSMDNTSLLFTRHSVFTGVQVTAAAKQSWRNRSAADLCNEAMDSSGIRTEIMWEMLLFPEVQDDRSAVLQRGLPTYDVKPDLRV